MFELHFVTQMAFSHTRKDQNVLLLLFYGRPKAPWGSDCRPGQGQSLKNISSMQCGGKIMDMRYGIVVRGGNSIQTTIISTRTPIPR